MTKRQDNTSLTRLKEQTGRERASYAICNIFKKHVNTTRYVHLPCKRKWQLDPGRASRNTLVAPLRRRKVWDELQSVYIRFGAQTCQARLASTMKWEANYGERIKLAKRRMTGFTTISNIYNYTANSWQLGKNPGHASSETKYYPIPLSCTQGRK